MHFKSIKLYTLLLDLNTSNTESTTITTFRYFNLSMSLVPSLQHAYYVNYTLTQKLNRENKRLTVYLGSVPVYDHLKHSLLDPISVIYRCLTRLS